MHHKWSSWCWNAIYAGPSLTHSPHQRAVRAGDTKQIEESEKRNKVVLVFCRAENYARAFNELHGGFDSQLGPCFIF